MEEDRETAAAHSPFIESLALSKYADKSPIRDNCTSLTPHRQSECHFKVAIDPKFSLVSDINFLQKTHSVQTGRQSHPPPNPSPSDG